VTKIITIALIAGLILFSALVYYINEIPLIFRINFSDPILIATFILAITCIPSGFIYSKSYWNKVNQNETIIKKLMTFQSGLIIRLAFCEGVGLFSVIGFLMTGNLVYSVVLLIVIIAMLYNYPSPDSIGTALNLTSSEIDLLDTKYNQTR
jgi:hypothetical protein